MKYKVVVRERSGQRLLGLLGFRGVLGPATAQAIQEFPRTEPVSTKAALTAVTRAMFCIAYEDFWKARCQAIQEAERTLGVTPAMKRRPMARDAERPRPAPTTARPRSPRLGASQDGDRTIWRAANQIFRASGP